MISPEAEFEERRRAEAQRAYINQVNAHRDAEKIFEPGRAFVAAMRYQAVEPNRAYSYGPGHGLEADSTIALETFSEGRWLRAFDELMMAEILNQSVHDSATKVELAMGPSPVSAAAMLLIGQMQEPGNAAGEEIRGLWIEHDQVAAEMLCWHTVARLRMATEGHFPPYVDLGST